MQVEKKQVDKRTNRRENGLARELVDRKTSRQENV